MRFPIRFGKTTFEQICFSLALFKLKTPALFLQLLLLLLQLPLLLLTLLVQLLLLLLQLLLLQLLFLLHQLQLLPLLGHVELVLQLAVHRWFFFINGEWNWNLLDFVLVGTALFDLMFQQVVDAENNFTFMRSLRLLRPSIIYES